MNERTGQTTGNGPAMGFLVGALLGAGVALLMAPAKGSDTRRRIGETARRLRRDVPAKARGLANQASVGPGPETSQPPIPTDGCARGTSRLRQRV